MTLRRYFGTKTKWAFKLKTTCLPRRISLEFDTDQAVQDDVVQRKSFRYRVYPTQELLAVEEDWNDALRALWNLANEQWLIGLDRLARARALPSFSKRTKNSVRLVPSAFSQSNELTELRAEFPWLAAVPRNVCNQLLVELDKAWQRCFAGLAEAPKWKKKGVDAINFCEPHPNAWRLDIADGNPRLGWLKFPKLADQLRVIVHRSLEGTPKTCTLLRDGDQWFVSISCEIEAPEPALRTEPKIALDRGITNFVGTSDGGLVRGPQYLKALLRQLARAQRSVHRREKGSQNYKKAQRCVMRLHRTIRRQRAHFLHEQSARFTKSHGVIVLEELNVAGMMRGNCSRGIADSGWSMFKNMCVYKQAWSGGSVQLVPAQYSSQECFVCEHVDAKSRRGEVFRCMKCGRVDHADINAAKVLLRRANRSVQPVEGALPEAPLGSRKAESKKLRVPRRPSGASPKPTPLGGG